MRVGIKRLLMLLCSMLLMVTIVSIGYVIPKALESTSRNEQYAPSEYNVSVQKSEGYSKIYENRNFEYYYSSGKTILRIVNKNTGFAWQTGAGNLKNSEIASKCSSVSRYSDEYYACAIDVGPTKRGSNTEETYAETNGLLYFTYFDSSNNNTVRKTFTETNFYGHKSYANEWMFKVSYVERSGDELRNEFNINMRFTFNEDGFDVNIFDGDVTGISADKISSIVPLPRLGQSGGKVFQCRIDEVDEDGKGECKFNDTSTMIDNPNTNLDGYIFVPDGSGALIRFDNVKYYPSNNSTYYFDMYGDPYRDSYTDSEFQGSFEIHEKKFVPTKHISMPVWGVAYGNDQDAFVAYVKKGAEYFGLIYQGRTDSYEYASIQPRFERNRTYTYKFGDGKTTQSLSSDEVYHYDISISYNFLSGDGSDGRLPANYVGMALKYRDYLQKNHLVNEDVDVQVGPKVDFLLSDVKTGIIGYTQVDVTTTDDVVNILNDLHTDGLNNIQSTLYGWQNGGASKGKPWNVDYNSSVGGKRGIKDILELASNYDYRINFAQQYAMLSEAQTKSYNAYCVKTLARTYGYYVLSDIVKPLTWWVYVNADVEGKWLNNQAKTLAKLGDNIGISTIGMSTLLVPDYGKRLSYKDAANALYQATKDAKNNYNVRLTGDTPNSYLWRNYESFTNISVYNSQYQCETDSVPFYEIVFGGLVNMYAEYANFSFYDEISQLKMIDYNLNPSFIITAKENSDIMYTNSRDWFSTSYDRFHPIINNICDKVLPILNEVKGKTVVNRKVVELESGELGLYVNTYATYKDSKIGDDKTVIAINYLTHDVTYNYNGNDVVVKARSAVKLGG